MSDNAQKTPQVNRPPLYARLDLPIVISFACIILLLLVGSLYSSSFLSPEYLLQQLKVASFLGIIATGMMLVVLMGQIDLSVPWVLTTGAMMASAATAFGPFGEAFAVPFGILCGVGMGLISGAGIAYLRIPAMIVTLAMNVIAQGLMVAYSGGASPADSASDGMRYLATGTLFFNIPNAIIVWAIVAGLAVFVLNRTSFGRAVYAIGNRESAAFLSGAATQRIMMIGFAISGGLAAFGGVLLAGYAGKAAQSMGDAYLLPAIAAVVLGGTSILGGRGNYLGTIAGVILVTLLQSILSVMQIAEFGRQVIYGVVIVTMLLLYGRERALR